MLWLNRVGFAGARPGHATQGMKGLPGTGKMPKPQQEKAFSVANWRAAESCECQQNGAAHLPPGHSGGLALLGMLG